MIMNDIYFKFKILKEKENHLYIKLNIIYTHGGKWTSFSAIHSPLDMNLYAYLLYYCIYTNIIISNINLCLKIQNQIKYILIKYLEKYCKKTSLLYIISPFLIVVIVKL